MSLVCGLLGALCAGASAWLVVRRGTEKPKTARLAMAAAIALGAFCGWFAMERTGGDWLILGRILTAVFVLAGAACTDLDCCRIPNRYPLILLGGFFLFTLLDRLLGRAGLLELLLGGCFGAGVVFLVLLLLRVLSRGGIGYGDIKLLTGLGGLLGLYGTGSILLFGQLSAVLCIVVLLALGRVSWKDSIPFAPFFYLGFALTLWAGTF